MLEQHPPVALVKTWYELIMQSSDRDAKQRATRMLIGVFGDLPTAIEYLKHHNLLTKPGQN